MALANVNITKLQGGLARLNQTTDGVSGLVWIQSGASFNQGVYKLNAPEDAITTLNITADTVAGGAVLKYHIDEYFRVSDSPLYIKTTSASTDYSEVIDLKNFSNGEIYQNGVFDYDKDFSTTSIQALNTIVKQTETEEAPLVALYGSKAGSGLTVNGLTDIGTLESDGVGVTIAEDLSEGSEAVRLKGLGAKVVGSIGIALGTVSKNQVHVSMGNVSQNNLVDSEWQTPGFITGEKLSDISKTLQNTLDSYHYIFVRKFTGLSGSYFNYSYTAGLSTSDFNTIENNRTYNKAYRLLRAALVPQVNSSIYVDKDGNLSIGTVAFFKGICDLTLQQMKDLGELSGFIVSIDPKQKPLQTNSIEIICKIQPVGVAKFIDVKLGFTLSL